MGSSHEPSKRKRRNSDCISNYVDRVRICDTKSVASESVYSKASQKSGWRQKSYSSIDLSSANSDYQPGAGVFHYRDFDAQDDVSIKNSKNNKDNETIQRDYEDIYNVNPKAQGYKREIIKEHNKINQNKRDNDVCSLRRSKSLAVIREETYNDLTIGAPKARRSQLIPRAKLIDRHFFKDRLSFALEESLSFSLDSTLTSENNKNSCNTNNSTSNNSGNNNNNTNNNNSSSSNNNYFAWNCDKSDLGSIDSNFFKNSLHQGSSLLDKSNSFKTDPTKIVSRAEIHNENIINSDESDGGLAAEAEEGEGINGSTDTKKSENYNNNNHNINTNDNESTVNINEDTESGITIIEIRDKKQLSGPTSSVISYDSIYLSSESDKQTILGETINDDDDNFNDIDLKIKDFEKIIRELNLIGDSEKSDTIIDNLYSQVAKGSVSSLFDLNGEAKINANTLSKYTDYISKGTLERLTILSGFSPHNSNSRKIEKDKRKSNESVNHKGDFQYSSLPDVDISKLLRDCELIDAKLRDDVSIELLEPYPDYDIDLSNEPNNPSFIINKDESNNHKHQGEEVEEVKSLESDSIGVKKSTTTAVSNEPESLDEENPKGAPSIELVQLSTKELDNTAALINNDDDEKICEVIDERLRNTTKIYIPDLGLELDYENSIASFDSDDEDDFETTSVITTTEEFIKESNPDSFHHYPFFNPPTFNLVTISGRKVIVDELAAKSEQKDVNNKENNNNNNNNIHENSSASSSSSSSINKEKIVDKIITSADADNSSQRHKTNIDKKVERKIKLPECKQAQNNVDSANDKEIIIRKNSNADESKIKKVQYTAECKRDSLIASSDKRKSKDYSSFCVLQQTNSNQTTKEMPRPQLLNIVDSKNSVPKIQQTIQSISTNSNKDVRKLNNESEDEKADQLNETEKEFLHKVDSVRNYWSRMLDNEAIDMKRNSLKSISQAFSASKSSNDIPQSLRNEETFQSFFPTVEIVELNNGETQAALVTARKLNDVEFDHVRYKVMKSEMFQKNIVRSGNNKHRKETQFDGLMQYLQDYSFQELLANNNVVIIEPVRTKIEKISEKPSTPQSAVCKITNGATGLSRNGSNNLKKHFFYHPIRVNKELYEDELPVPDTVRNVRKLFEESLRLSCASSKLSERDSKMSKSSDNLKPRKTIRYLTIDTSFDNNLATSKWDSISLSSGVSSADLSSPCECQESASSRNVSNSSSNGSKENLDNNDDSEKTSFVNADVLEKIRECGSSITYYGSGGAPTTQMSSENEKINPELMTKVITKDVGVAAVRAEKCSCHGRQSRYTTSSNEKLHHHNHHHHHYNQQQQPQQLFNKKMNNDYTGFKFKLVKSNSCSSRLELAGTGICGLNAVEEMRNIVHGQKNQLYDEHEEEEEQDAEEDEHYAENEANDHKKDFEHEETVKDMIYKLETKNFIPTKPRIIESRCIEKVPALRDSKVTINNQTFEKVKNSNSSKIVLASSTAKQQQQEQQLNIDSQENENVTVNNHISILSTAAVAANTSELNNPIQNDSIEGSKILSKPKIVRNRNVDLALAAVNKKKEIVKNPLGFSRSNSDMEPTMLAQNETHHHETHEIPNNNNNNNNLVKASRSLSSSSSISTSTMQSVEMVKNQDKINCAHQIKNYNSSHSTSNRVTSNAEETTDEKLPAKMVNWSTVGVLTKEYIANDNKLKHTKTYDEMEFEEFEVAGEHYDSLNSK